MKIRSIALGSVAALLLLSGSALAAGVPSNSMTDGTVLTSVNDTQKAVSSAQAASVNGADLSATSTNAGTLFNDTATQVNSATAAGTNSVAATMNGSTSKIAQTANASLVAVGAVSNGATAAAQAANIADSSSITASQTAH